MVKVLVIDEETRTRIKLAIEKARASPISWEAIKDIAQVDVGQMLKLADRKPNVILPRAEQVLLMGYRAAISFEHQPAGLFRHLSVSSDEKGKLPHPAAMSFIAKEFGFDWFPPSNGRVWLEEFEPDWCAVNVVELVDADR